MTPLSAEAELYLKRLRQALSSQPTAERDETVAELRSHFLGRQEQGQHDVLAGFEPPDALAAAFVSERALRGALAIGTPWAMGRALLIATRESLLGLVTLLPLALAQLTGFCLLLTAALKPFMPNEMGLWVGPGNFYIGINRDNPALREVLGWWSIALLPLCAALLFWLSTRAMMALIRARLKTLRSP